MSLMTTTQTTNKKRLEALRELANENIDVLCEALDLTLNDHGSYLNGRCPVHGGNNSTGFSFSKTTGIWKCWTKGCHTQMGQDIFALIRLIKDCTFAEAVKFVEECFDVRADDLKTVLERVDNNKFARKEQAKIIKQSPYSDDIIKGFGYHPYFLERGFSQEILNKYEAGYCTDARLPVCGRMVLPVRDEDGALVGFTGRLVEEDENRPKWKHEGKIHNYLYNLNFAREHIKKHQAVILVEGPLKVLKLEEAGIHNAVCIWGVNSLSERQLRLLLESEAFTVVIALDKDEAGARGTNRIEKQLSQYFYMHNFVLPRGYFDLDEMHAAEVKDAFAADEICKKFLEV